MTPRREGSITEALRALAYESFQIAYKDDPAGFVEDCLRFPAGESPTPYQLEVIDALPRESRIAVRGPHGLGKTAMASWLVLWFALTRDGTDWKVPTTASVSRQLREYLWPDIHKWASAIRWEVVGRPPFRQPAELQTMHLRLTTGSAFPAASNNPAQIEGAHADHLLFVYDEAKAVPDPTYDATEGAFAGAIKELGREAYALAFSTPGSTSGRFYAIHARRPGFEDWWTRAVTLDEATKARRISLPWAEQRAKQWGAKSAMYRQRVLGQFASDEQAVIPLEWAEAAVNRWMELPEEQDGGVKVDRNQPAFVIADIADTGADENVIGLRWGPVIRAFATFPGLDLMDTTGKIAQVAQVNDARPVVDVIGIGSGVVARLRELGMDVIAFNASERTAFMDRTGELGFANKRSAAWWNLRELLDPELGLPICLPDDDLLISDLTTPRYRMVSGGKIQIEPKDGTRDWGIRQRIGRSTDRGDMVVMAFFVEVMSFEDEPVGEYLVEYDQPTTISPV